MRKQTSKKEKKQPYKPTTPRYPGFQFGMYVFRYFPTHIHTLCQGSVREAKPPWVIPSNGLFIGVRPYPFGWGGAGEVKVRKRVLEDQERAINQVCLKCWRGWTSWSLQGHPKATPCPTTKWGLREAAALCSCLLWGWRLREGTAVAAAEELDGGWGKGPEDWLEPTREICLAVYLTENSFRVWLPILIQSQTGKGLLGNTVPRLTNLTIARVCVHMWVCVFVCEYMCVYV